MILLALAHSWGGFMSRAGGVADCCCGPMTLKACRQRMSACRTAGGRRKNVRPPRRQYFVRVSKAVQSCPKLVDAVVRRRDLNHTSIALPSISFMQLVMSGPAAAGRTVCGPVHEKQASPKKTKAREKNKQLAPLPPPPIPAL